MTVLSWEQRAKELAQMLLQLAEQNMPDSYVQTDRRCQLARETLEERSR